jgi:hypothetical protein
MAALALRFGTLPAGFLERFGQELPFAWEAVPLASWRDAVDRLEHQCVSAFGEDAAELVFSSHLEKRTNSLSSASPALAYFLGIIGAHVLPKWMQQAQALKYVGKQAGDVLFEGEDCQLMTLRRAHADDDWPVGFEAIFASANVPPSIDRYLFQVHSTFRMGVVNLPLLLAVQAATNRSDFWFADSDSIHLMRTYRAFDPEWFDEAYNQTIARCLSDGLLDIE